MYAREVPLHFRLPQRAGAKEGAIRLGEQRRVKPGSDGITAQENPTHPTMIEGDPGAPHDSEHARLPRRHGTPSAAPGLSPIRTRLRSGGEYVKECTAAPDLELTMRRGEANQASHKRRADSEGGGKTECMWRLGSLEARLPIAASVPSRSSEAILMRGRRDIALGALRTGSDETYRLAEQDS